MLVYNDMHSDKSKERVIRSWKSKDKKHNGQKKNGNRTNNDLQNTTQKTKEPATRTTLKSGCELRCSGGVTVPVPLVAPIIKTEPSNMYT